MQDTQISRISNFIWSVADDVLRDMYVRGKYRDVILPMLVLRRLDAVLEPTKQRVLEEKGWLDEAGITDQISVLEQVAGQAFYNTSPFTLRDLTSRVYQQQLRDDFTAYLDGFSPNVQDILDNFEFRHQIDRLLKGDALATLIERFLSPQVNFSPETVLHSDGSIRLPALDNHAMGTIFEELVRRFNEENNEEAGEHWTPRDAVELMAQTGVPAEWRITFSRVRIYCTTEPLGPEGCLPVAEQVTLQDLGKRRGQEISTHLYGQEVNSETYAICKADLLLKGEKRMPPPTSSEAPNFRRCPTMCSRSRTFDFMLSNPPYGKSWKTDRGRMGGKSGITDSSVHYPARR